MAKNYAYVTPELLKWARERVSLSAELVAGLLKVPIEKYLSWETGEKYPTINQAKKFAKKVKIPYVWLYLPTPPEKYKLPVNADYRRFDNYCINEQNDYRLKCVLSDISMRRDVMIDLYKDIDTPLPRFEQYIDLSINDNFSIADKVRSILGISIGIQKRFKDSREALNHYIEKLSDIGILVFQEGEMDRDIMLGMSLYDSVFPIIVINRKDEINARIFTLIHEFVHIITQTPAICDVMWIDDKNSLDIEKRCNLIAAEALVHSKDLQTDSNYQHIEKYGWDDEKIRRIAGTFKVSREVILGRLFTLKIIDKQFFYKKLSQYKDEYLNFKNKKDEASGFVTPDINIVSKVGKLYARTVLTALNQEVITLRDASVYLSGLKIQHFDNVERRCFS